MLDGLLGNRPTSVFSFLMSAIVEEDKWIKNIWMITAQSSSDLPYYRSTHDLRHQLTIVGILSLSAI